MGIKTTSEGAAGVWRKCGDCDGVGSVRVLDYREMEMNLPTKPEKKPFPYKKVGKITLLTLAWATGIGCFCGFMYVVAHGAHIDDARKRMNGELIVETEPNGHQRCFIQRSGTYTSSNPIVKVIINDRYDDVDIANDAKLIDWDYTSNGCKRFHYEGDDADMKLLGH